MKKLINERESGGGKARRKANTGRRKYAANKVLAAPAERIVMQPEPSALILEVRKERRKKISSRRR